VKLNYLFRLTRFPVSLAVTFSAFAAALLSMGDKFSGEVLWSILAIFLLASGASALNQYQEWQYDEKMERTRRRPIPSRAISTGQALNNATLMIIGGYAILILMGEWLPLVLGVFNVFWYNGVYTLLKRKTAFAVVPGALTGAIPVYMGWTAAGGGMADHVPLFLSLFIFLWQMPHFWLIMLKYGEEYETAGFPALTSLLSPPQMKRIIFVWVLASSGAAAMLIYFGIIRHEVISLVLAGLNALVVLLIFYGLFIGKSVNYRLLFIAGNLLMLFMFLLAVIDRFVS
jgi:heme o synthase